MVEVTLAVAIAAVAMITFLGLLPMGLETSRKTSTRIANANMLEQVVQNLDGLLWGANNGNVPSLGSKQRLYFNEEGTQVPSGSTDMTYLVEVEYRGPANLDKNSGTQSFLQRALIRIQTPTAQGFSFPPRVAGRLGL